MKNLLKARKSGKKGFTLMEMLIVVAIIAILIAIAIPTFGSALTKAKVAADTANLRAYYAEAMANHLLEDTDLPKVDTATNEVTINGVTYTLQAGKYTVAVTDDTMTITYTYGNDKTVTIPGGAAE